MFLGRIVGRVWLGNKRRLFEQDLYSSCIDNELSCSSSYHPK